MRVVRVVRVVRVLTVEAVDALLPLLTGHVAVDALVLIAEVLQEILQDVQHARHLHTAR